MTQEDIKGECRPSHLPSDRLHDTFYDNLPVRTDGFALPNKEAGINISKRDKSLGISNKQVDYNLKKTNLREQIT